MEFTIYSKPNCTFCEQAKLLLAMKGFSFKELIIDVGQPKDTNKQYVSVHELKSKVPTAQSVPQIFKNEEHIGGYEALKQLVA